MKKIERTVIDKPRGGRAKIERPQRPPRGTQWPKFDTLFNPITDVLEGFEPTDDQEDNATQIMDRVAEGFINADQRKLDDYRAMVSGDFYFVVCFQSGDQKYEFLDKAGMTHLGDLYIDGLKLAKLLGVDVAPIPLPTREPKRMPRLLRDIQIIPRGGEK
jgi:hypothetical protein